MSDVDVTTEAVERLFNQLHVLVQLKERSPLHEASAAEAAWLLSVQEMLRTLRAALTASEARVKELEQKCVDDRREGYDEGYSEGYDAGCGDAT